MNQNGIGFIGLGKMGLPMARNLARTGLSLAVYNRTPSKCEELVRDFSNVSRVATPKEVAENATVVFTMLSDDRASETVYLGENGLLEAVQGKTAVEMGTVSHAHCLKMHERILVCGGDFIDAPVSGSVVTASKAELLIMAGGSEQALSRAMPLLGKMGRKVICVGEAGSGSLIKIVVNSIIHSLNQILAEALSITDARGIDAEKTLEIILESAAGAPMYGYRKNVYLDEENQPVTFDLELAAKDLGFMLELGKSAGRNLPQTEINLKSLLAAVEAGYGKRDMGALVSFFRKKNPKVS